MSEWTKTDTQTLSTGLTMAAHDLPMERFTDPVYGEVSWQTLICADRTPTRALTCGLAHLEPGQCLALHTHAPEEVYFGVSGRATVYIDGVGHDLAPGVAVYIPGHALHGVFAGDEAASFFYVFPRDSFAEVDYNFLPAAQPDNTNAPIGDDPTTVPMPDLDPETSADILHLSQFDSDDAPVQ